MATPTIPTGIIAAVAGLFGFVLYKMLKLGSPASSFKVVAGVQFWEQGEANAIRAALEQAHLEPTLDASTSPPTVIERVFTVRPGAGAESALVAVRKIQAQKHIVTSSVNLLDPSAQKRLVADVLPTEEKTLTTGADLAVLPVL